MRTLILIATSLLMSFGLLWAQPPRDSSQSSVQGCLQGGPGAFTLAADNGTTYELVGDSKQLSKPSGMEVTVTGMKGSASDVSGGMYGHTGEATSNPTAGTAPTIKVTTATKLSDRCTK